jgi:hypothetical protein
MTNVSSSIVLDVVPVSGTPLIQLTRGATNSDFRSTIEATWVSGYRSLVPGGQLLAPSRSALVTGQTGRQDSVQVRPAAWMTTGRLAAGTFADYIHRHASVYEWNLANPALKCAHSVADAANTYLNSGRQINWELAYETALAGLECLEFKKRLSEEQKASEDQIKKRFLDERRGDEETRVGRTVTRFVNHQLEVRRALTIGEFRP